MKKITTVLLLIAAFGFTKQMHAQTVDEVIAKYIDAMGGKEKVASLKTVKMNGSLNVQGIDVGVTVTVSNGVGARTDISVPGMGEGFQIMNPTKGWSFMPFQGQASPEEVKPERVKASQSQLDLQGPLFNYKEKGYQVALDGKETVDGAEAFKIKLSSATGNQTTYYIDTKTYYKVKTITKFAGEDNTLEVSYSDFRKNEDGYLFPYAQTTPNGTIAFTTVETNKPVDPKIFTAE